MGMQEVILHLIRNTYIDIFWVEGNKHFLKKKKNIKYFYFNHIVWLTFDIALDPQNASINTHEKQI